MLNKQGKGKIDWTDYTWNPVTGCLHGCDYCYVKRFNDRFKYSMEPQFHINRMGDIEKLKKPSKIFVCSTGDLMGEWVKYEWICAVIAYLDVYPQHTFQLLTKNPARYDEFLFPKNCWLGTTLDGTQRTKNNLDILKAVRHTGKKFVSFEPVLAEPKELCFCDIDWLIIGANSNRGAIKPPDVWADKLLAAARRQHAAVWIKNNYGYHHKIKEFPGV